MIEITEIRIKKIKTNNRIVALATITINNSIVINDIKVLEGDNGLFIGMPSRKTQSGEYRDIAYPINRETRQLIQNAIIEEYNKID